MCDAYYSTDLLDSFSLSPVLKNYSFEKIRYNNSHERLQEDKVFFIRMSKWREIL